MEWQNLFAGNHTRPLQRDQEKLDLIHLDIVAGKPRDGACQLVAGRLRVGNIVLGGKPADVLANPSFRNGPQAPPLRMKAFTWRSSISEDTVDASKAAR